MDVPTRFRGRSRRRNAATAALIAAALTIMILSPELLLPSGWRSALAANELFRTAAAYVSALLWCAASIMTLRTLRASELARRAKLSFRSRLERVPARRLRAIAAAALTLAPILGAAFAPVELWRYLRFKVYQEYLLTPVDRFLHGGETSAYLVGAVLAAVAAGAVLLLRRRGWKLHIFALAAFLASSAAAHACPQTQEEPLGANAGKSLILVQEAAPTHADPNLAAGAPSDKNADGGYDAKQEILSCFAVMKFVYDGGRYENEEIFYRMRFPPRGEPGKKYPLIVWLHGYGESTGENMRQLAHLHRALPLFVGEEALDFYMIALQLPPDNPEWSRSLSDRGKGDSRLAILKELTERTIDEYPVDPARVSVMGVSSGATAAWRFIADSDRKIAAAALFSGTAPSSQPPETFSNVSIWAFNNREDGRDAFAELSQYVSSINAAGGDARLTAGEGASHDAWSEPLTEGEVFRWALDPYPIACAEESLPARQSTLRKTTLFVVPIWIIFLNLQARRRRENETD